MKEIWSKQWDEFTTWFLTQWKYAWELLEASIVGLIKSVFEWAYAILGAGIVGFWKLVLVPTGKYLLDRVIKWIKKI
jgi:hypothetical protein